VSYSSRRLFVTTVTLDAAIAADAMIGESSPSAAKGIPTTLYAKASVEGNRLRAAGKQEDFRSVLIEPTVAGWWPKNSRFWDTISDSVPES
jgi:hypothetical protein